MGQEKARVSPQLQPPSLTLSNEHHFKVWIIHTSQVCPALTKTSFQSTWRALLDEHRHCNAHLFPLHSIGFLPSTETGLGLLVLVGDPENNVLGRAMAGTNTWCLPRDAKEAFVGLLWNKEQIFFIKNQKEISLSPTGEQVLQCQVVKQTGEAKKSQDSKEEPGSRQTHRGSFLQGLLLLY